MVLHRREESNGAAVWGCFEITGTWSSVCLALQPGQWYWALSKEPEEGKIVQNHEEEGLQKRDYRGCPVFEMELIPTQYSRTVGGDHNNLNVRRAQHTNDSEPAVSSWLAGVS